MSEHVDLIIGISHLYVEMIARKAPCALEIQALLISFSDPCYQRILACPLFTVSLHPHSGVSAIIAICE